MFHLTIGDEYIVLLESEARGVFFAATGDAVHALTYNVNWAEPGAKRRLRTNFKVITDYLKSRMQCDEEGFRKQFVFRNHWGSEAVLSFFALMDGHRRLSPYVNCPDVDEFDRMDADPQLAMEYVVPEDISILLLSGGQRRRGRRVAIAEIAVTVAGIEHVFGTTRSFVMMTVHQKFAFTPEGLVITPRHRSAASTPVEDDAE